MDSIANKSVPQWVPVMNNDDYPNGYPKTFAAIVTTMVALCMPAFIANLLNEFLVNKLLSGDDEEFL